MAKKRVKKRTHIGASNATSKPGNAPSKPGDRSPKSMVIRIGASEVGPSVSQLVKDVRTLMEPATASRLKERRNNKLRDYTTMAGPLGVTHLLLFSRSENGNTNMRLAITPRGPTLHFRVEKYSLCKDIQKSQKRPRSGGSDFITAPLLVMNNITSKPKDMAPNGDTPQAPHIPKHLETLTASIFQSLFPAINPSTTSIKSIKRVLLLDRLSDASNDDGPSYVVNLRHFAIETRTAKSIPKALRRLDAAEKVLRNGVGQKRKRNALPNLGRLNDVADYMLDPHAADGFTSGSDSEPDTDAEVEVLAPAGQTTQRRNAKSSKHATDGDSRPGVQKKGIKLHELGPRLRLRLTKVEEGLCEGKVMWHQHIHKSQEEIREMDKIHDRKRQEKEKRRAEQRANVERKKADHKANGQEAADEDNPEDEILSDPDEWDDAEDLEDDDHDGDEEMQDAD